MSAKLWGGRFEKKSMDPAMMKFTSSIDTDKILAKYDCFSSKIHVDTLQKGGYLTREESEELKSALEKAESQVDAGKFSASGHEDIHSAIQAFVEEISPVSAKKLHTARSRNEQVVNDVRLYSRDSLVRVKKLIRKLQFSLVELASDNMDVIVPGYTHMKRAQPVLFAHLVLAYVEMLDRDAGRLADADKRVDISVMGSGAIAGSSLKLDRNFTADKLGFRNISNNSIDAVSDRDFMVEVLSALSIIAVHLSRMSEDFILYNTSEFNFLEIGADFCTGSSLMPQKKNPDVLELIRGRSASVIGALNALLILLKGLPSAYNRDLQEDKKPFFESVETVSDSLDMMSSVVGSVKLNKASGLKALDDEFIYATDVAEYLVGKGVSFRDAHDIVGAIVKNCCDKGINISDLSISELKAFSKDLDKDICGLLNAETSVGNKKTKGSTNPELVAREVARWKKELRSQDARI